MPCRALIVGFVLGLACPLSAASRQVSARPLDIVLVLDSSGSMKKNDPAGLMPRAVARFIRGLPADSRFAIVLFSERADLVADLAAAQGPDSALRLETTLSRLDYTGQFTDIPAAIERAIYELRDRRRPEALSAVILFTDGIVDVGHPARDLERRAWLQRDLALQARDLGIPVFGVAFTDAADFQLIQSVAQTTHADYFRVSTATDIAPTFARIGERLAGATRAEATAVPALPAAPPAARSLDGSWLARGAGLVALVCVAVWLRTRAARPGVKAWLRDLRGHTARELHPVKRRVFRVGREARGNDLAIPQPTVSLQHATIEFRGGGFYLRDFKSSNGTRLNGRKVGGSELGDEVPLKHGDRIHFDVYEFEFLEHGLPRPSADLGADEDVSNRGTVFRPGEHPSHQAAAPVSDRPPRPAIPPAKADPQATRVKTDRCPNHPGWKASELCSGCKNAFCHTCVAEVDGQTLCHACAAPRAGLSA